MKIGVLALQGDFREHIKMLERCGVDAIEVRLPEDMEGLKGLIIPGGESTTIGKLIKKYNLDSAIKLKHSEGMAIFGTCAGLILMSKEIKGSQQFRLGLLNIKVNRNAYGRQLDSFEEDIHVNGVGDIKGVFIRAPKIEDIYNGVEVLSVHKDDSVLVREGKLLGATFHPELTDNKKLHEFFIKIASEENYYL